MNWYFVAAAVLVFLTGLTHTVFGERMIFRRMRAAGFIPTNGGQSLREYQVRIVWATWHMVTLMAWCFAAILAWLALPAQAGLAGSMITRSFIAAMLASSATVGIGTKGKHLGWLALLATAVLTARGACL